MITRSYYYHIYDDPAFIGLPDYASASVPVKGLISTAPRTPMPVYSLRRDMAALRRLGVTKGIVDGSCVHVGTTHRNKRLYCLKVGKGSGHKVIITGAHHSREWISVEMAYLLAEFLITEYTSTPTNDRQRRVKHLVDNREIWFVPMVNPDGHMYNVTTNRLWRPNRKQYTLSARSFAAPQLGGGTRPLSYPAGRYRAQLMATQDPGEALQDSIWSGPSPASELETQRIAAMLRWPCKGGISYHSYGLMIIRPTASRTNAFVRDVGSGMSSLISSIHGSTYSNLYGGQPPDYPVTGDMMDYATERSTGRPFYTIELRPSSGGHSAFILPRTQIQLCFEENLSAGLAVINCAGHTTCPAFRVIPRITVSPPYVTIQIVHNCWSVFSGWLP